MMGKKFCLGKFLRISNFSLFMLGWIWDFKNKIKQPLIAECALLENVYELVFKGFPGMWLMHFDLCFKSETEEIWDKVSVSGEDLSLHTAFYSRLAWMVKIVSFTWEHFSKEVLLQLIHLVKNLAFKNYLSRKLCLTLGHIKM